ncbi:MAG: 30S ribosomal protein S11 [Candidatus Coatesbacteria bacterium]|jgi:small subunit ribosomal protein S11|nr:30S ribosomal protein S11 [Candidatus Coatesbacteria bacterium]
MSARRSRRSIKFVEGSPEGIINIRSSFNNTIISVTTLDGRVIGWGSAGTAGFKGSKKSTPFAAQVTAGNCAKKALDAGIRKVEVHIKGPGSGRESAIRGLSAAGLGITAIKDITSVPHNGCRPKKRRRL